MNTLMRVIKWAGILLALGVLFLGQAGAAFAQQEECILQSSTGPADYYPIGQEAPAGRNTVCVPIQSETGLAVMTGFDPAEYYPLNGQEVPAARNVSVDAIRAEEQLVANRAQGASIQAASSVQQPVSLPKTGSSLAGSWVVWPAGIAAAILFFASGWLFRRRTSHVH